MCAEFVIRRTPEEIAALFEREFYNETGEREFDFHVRLYEQAPLLLVKNKKPVIEKMRFSLKPPGTPYPTFNARLLSWDEKKKELIPIYAKPTWRGPLQKHRALVPLSGFIEPVYTNEYAGQMVRFTAKDQTPLLVPALYEESVDKKTGEIYQGFSLILTTPSEFVQKIGHHRQPVFLSPRAGLHWIQEGELSPQKAMEILSKGAVLPPLNAETERAMAKGWEKRIPESKAKLAKEVDFMRREAEASFREFVSKHE
jgi:putative SOS response-associated peptidase YedK